MPRLFHSPRTSRKHFFRIHSQDASGRFVVHLPLRLPLPDLSGTKHFAARLLGYMEQKFACDDQLNMGVQEYEVLGHMSPARPAGAAGSADCYLPYYGVMRKGSSAKIRVVFNGSSTVPSGASVLSRWRVHRFVLAIDIEKMYRQILVAPKDRHLQRILWRHGPDLLRRPSSSTP
ncbi:hypothetical protein ACFW04_012232 [Cataglyphis niger]